MVFHVPDAGRFVLFGLAIAWLSLPSAAFAGVDEELAQAATSPIDIARFVDTHITFEWEPLWKALGIQGDDVFMQPCGELGGPKRDCSEERVTVLDPFQVIVVLRHKLPMPEVYLRFLRQSGPDSSGPWKFGGYYSPLSKYFEPRHRTLRIGEKPFLVVTRQGTSGSDWASEVDDWMDLTSPNFDPVLSLTTQGHYSGNPDRVGLETNCVVVSMGADPAERVEVAYSVRFTHEGEPFANRSDRAVYIRRGTVFQLDATRSKTPQSDIDNLYEMDSDGPSNEDYLRYLLADFRKIATGPDGKLKDWLKRFLGECENTVERRELQALVSAPPK